MPTGTDKKRTRRLVNPFELAYQPTAFEKVTTTLSKSTADDVDWMVGRTMCWCLSN